MPIVITTAPSYVKFWYIFSVDDMVILHEVRDFILDSLIFLESPRLHEKECLCSVCKKAGAYSAKFVDRLL